LKFERATKKIDLIGRSCSSSHPLWEEYLKIDGYLTFLERRGFLVNIHLGLVIATSQGGTTSLEDLEIFFFLEETTVDRDNWFSFPRWT
jgi:hypothetical protein